LTHRDDIWDDSELLEGPHLLSRSAEAGLNFISDTDPSDIVNDLVYLKIKIEIIENTLLTGLCI
jgi:hypothetical protein